MEMTSNYVRKSIIFIIPIRNLEIARKIVIIQKKFILPIRECGDHLQLCSNICNPYFTYKVCGHYLQYNLSIRNVEAAW